MKRESAVAFAGQSRVHIGLEVADLERSLSFYRVLLGSEPSKVRPGYAKFEPAEPPVNLSLNEGPGGRRTPGASDHFGIQVQSSDAVDAMIARFQAAGIQTRVERDSACCYSVQDKVWVADPDGNAWEVFVVIAAESERRFKASSSCAPASGAAAGACPCA
jgi:catechol 2,3-dioxygenase-like lactoylglutathione lyase family enzyme